MGILNDMGWNTTFNLRKGVFWDMNKPNQIYGNNWSLKVEKFKFDLSECQVTFRLTF